MSYEIEVNNLKKAFGRRQVLSDISFKLKHGEFLTIFGPNGAGKTTLIKTLATLLKPTDGEIKINGYSFADDPAVIRRQIGFISHQPLLYLDLSAYENLEFYGSLYGVDDLQNRILQLLRKVELSSRRYDLVRTFSKGMQQRLAIARALIHQPRILFLDEPHSGLDPHAVEILDNLIAEIRADHSFIMITHNLEKGLALSDKIMILKDGRIIYEKEKGSLNNEEFKQMYFQAVKGEVPEFASF